MKLRFVLTLLAANAVAPAAALAQGNTSGAVGGTVGAAAPPAPVVTYVERHPVPTVAVEEEIIVGKPLPKTVKLYTIPEHRTYRYAVVNNQRVIVGPKTRTVVRIVE